MRYLYHATKAKNLSNIINEGIKIGIDRIVYLAETKEDALKFIAIRVQEPIIIFEIKFDAKDEKDIIETFDHNYSFFKCKSFGYTKNISFNKIKNCWRYE